MKKNYCDDCKTELVLQEQLKVLDQYDNKLLVCNSYYCPKCFTEYEINEEVDRVTGVTNMHKKAFDTWNEGNIINTWYDKDNVLCVKYDSGKWFHYRLNNNEVEWW